MPENNALARQFTLPSLMRFALPNIIMMVFLSIFSPWRWEDNVSV